MRPDIRDAVRKIIELLVVGNYTQIEEATHCIRLSAEEIARAIHDYGKELVLPPEAGFNLMDIVEIKNGQTRRWSVAMPLWTKEEGRSDLTLEMTISETRNGLSVEIDDVHVL